MGVGAAGQRILDLGTGTGALAREFARQGAVVSGTDIAAGQIAAARELAAAQELSIDFRVAGAEEVVFPSDSFDGATANQCWLYFEPQRTLAALRAQVTVGGFLLTSHFSWLPRQDKIARASEQLVLRFNPNWSAGDWDGEIPAWPEWARESGLPVRTWFAYDEAVAFTREGWRGRMRACRGVGAALSAAEVAAFDRAHDELLQRIAPAEFTVLHRIDAHLYELN
jgi:SAM-dependent methyltransferase